MHCYRPAYLLFLGLWLPALLWQIPGCAKNMAVSRALQDASPVSSLINEEIRFADGEQK